MSQEVITIFQDYPQVIEKYEDHLPALNVLKEIVGRNNFYLETDGTCQVMNYVGFFQKGDTRIQILPKIYSRLKIGDDDAQSELQQSIDFVYRLLIYTGYSAAKALPPQLQGTSKTDLLEIFIGIFINQFNDLMLRKIYRSYVQVEENEVFVKGKVLFSETLLKNPVLKHLHYIKYDEFSVNNSLNQIFKSVISELVLRTNESQNKKALLLGLSYLHGVDYVYLHPALFDQVHFDRLNVELQPLFNLAKLFFFNMQPGLTGGNQHVISFLVPMYHLFEHYIGKKLNECLPDGYTLGDKNPSRSLYKNGAFNLEPDFTIFKEETEVKVILDAKYKCPFDEEGKIIANREDIFQLLTYALRYNCNNIVLIYPRFLDRMDDTILETRAIESPFGEIEISLIQIDITMNPDSIDFSNVIKYLARILKVKEIKSTGGLNSSTPQ